MKQILFIVSICVLLYGCTKDCFVCEDEQYSEYIQNTDTIILPDSLPGDDNNGGNGDNGFPLRLKRITTVTDSLTYNHHFIYDSLWRLTNVVHKWYEDNDTLEFEFLFEYDYYTIISHRMIYGSNIYDDGYYMHYDYLSTFFLNVECDFMPDYSHVNSKYDKNSLNEVIRYEFYGSWPVEWALHINSITDCIYVDSNYISKNEIRYVYFDDDHDYFINNNYSFSYDKQYIDPLYFYYKLMHYPASINLWNSYNLNNSTHISNSVIKATGPYPVETKTNHSTIYYEYY